MVLQPSSPRTIELTVSRIAMVRHGRTEWNAAKRLQGRSDIPLDRTGRQQAHEVGKALAEGAWDVLICSPLLRAVETALIIAQHTGLQIATAPEFVERDCGEHEGRFVGGMTESEISMLYGSGETEQMVANRGVGALQNLVNIYPQKRIIVVAHGSLIRLTLSTLLRQPHPLIANGQIVEMELCSGRPDVQPAQGDEERFTVPKILGETLVRLCDIDKP